MQGMLVTPVAMHLHEHADRHNKKSSSIHMHYKSEHNAKTPKRFLEQFHVLAKCNNKFDCPMKKMLFNRKLQPTLNVQTDSVRVKVFVVLLSVC